MIEAIIRYAVHYRRVTIGLWILAAAIASVFAIRLSLDALPDLTNAQVQVLTRAPGLAPTEVELQVTRPIEAAVASIPGVESHRSISRYGLSAITIVFIDGTDLLRARQLVGERLQGVRMPPNADSPELGPMTGGLGEVFQFAMTSTSDKVSLAEVLKLLDLRVAPLLRAVPGIVEVNAWGGALQSFDVVVEPAKLVQYELTLGDVAEATQRATGRAAGASLPLGASQVLLRGSASPADVGALATAVVGRHQGQLVRISDIGRVQLGELPRIGAATLNGQGETVYVMTQMLLGANARDVAHRVRQAFNEAQKLLPPEVKMTVVYDRSTLVDKTLVTLRTNLAEGGALVAAVLLLMLGRLRAGLIVALAIPVSMIGATAVMSLVGIPGNLMSLGAIDFGLLVDGAVVMIDAVFHDVQAGKQRGKPWREQVLGASIGVGRPVFFSVLITLMVYLPILLMEGVDGKLFRPMAITVVLALCVSLAFALTLVPALASAWLSERRIPATVPFHMRAIDNGYARLLPWLTRLRAGIAVGALTLLVVAAWLFSQAGQEMTPTLDEGDLVLQTTRTPDISIEASVKRSLDLERSIMARVPEVAQISSRIGSPAVATDVMGIEQADVFIGLRPLREWRAGRHKADIIAEVEAIVAEVSPNADPAITQPIQMRFNELLGGAASDVVVSIYGEDLATLADLGDRYASTLQGIKGVEDVRVLVPDQVPLVEVLPVPAAASQFGLASQDVLDAVTAMRVGLPAGTAFQGPWQIPILVKTTELVTPAQLGQALVPTRQDVTVPLRDLAAIQHTKVPGAVLHSGGLRRITLGFNVRGVDLGSAVANSKKACRDIGLPIGYRVTWGGQYETLAHARQRLLLVAPLVLVLIGAVLWFAFHSVRHLLIVMTHVPFACVGGMVVLALRGMPVSMSAYIGFIALAGIAVMNGVVLLSYARERELGGEAPSVAIAHAALARARPVLMTATVAALGFVPMMLATGVGAEVQRPLASVIVGGLITSTVLTLLIVPALYPWLRGRKPIASPTGAE